MKVSIVGSLRDREVACSASDRQGSNFEYCVWRTVSSQSSHHPQEVLLAQFSLYVHKGGLKPDSFHFIFLFGKKARSSSCCSLWHFSLFFLKPPATTPHPAPPPLFLMVAPTLNVLTHDHTAFLISCVLCCLRSSVVYFVQTIPTSFRR